MGKWMDLAKKLPDDTGGPAVSALSADSADSPESDARLASQEPNCTNCTNCAEIAGTAPEHCGSQLAKIAEGLALLRSMKAPEIAPSLPQAWPVIVADATMLVKRNYAQQALALGWHPLHLFGVAPDELSDARDGLAVWLNGSRNLILIDQCTAVSREGDLHRCFNCRSTDGAVFLWDLN